MDGTVSRKLLALIACAGLLLSLSMAGCKTGRASRKCIKHGTRIHNMILSKPGGGVTIIPQVQSYCQEYRERPKRRIKGECAGEVSR